MLCGIREILIISTPRDLPVFQELLGDGQQLGCSFSYIAQAEPNGLPEAFLLGEDFIGNGSVALILGDNIFYGTGLGTRIRRCTDPDGSIILAYQVADPSAYGVVTFGSTGKVLDITEKPKKPRSNYIVPGLYFYEQGVVEVVKGLRPSTRGELEITDLHNYYLRAGRLSIEVLSRGTAWLDAGTFSSLIAASQFVQLIEERQGLKVGCIEEVAYRMGYIPAKQVRKLAAGYAKNGYGDYLLSTIRQT